MNRLQEYSFLWDGSQPGWVLVKPEPGQCNYTIYNTETKMFLVIEISADYEWVCFEMLQRGVRVVDQFP